MWPFSEMSLATASLVGTIANWLLLASLIGGVLSTFVIVKTSDVKEEYLAKDRLMSNERIVELTTQGELAQKETAEAKLQLEQLRFPRSLDIDKFKLAVSKMPTGSIEVLFDANAPDASFLATLIWGVFVNAKWRTAQRMGPTPLRPPPPNNDLPILANLPWTQAAGGGPWGLSVVSNDIPDLDTNAVGAALVHALMESVNGPPSQTTLGRAYGDLPAGMLRIIVGPKLP